MPHVTRGHPTSKLQPEFHSRTFGGPVNSAKLTLRSDGVERGFLTDDGFEIARADLRLRGMGDLFGERQHGEQTFKVADPIRDEELSERARLAAEQLLARDPDLTQPVNATLKRVMTERYARSLELFRVG